MSPELSIHKQQQPQPDVDSALLVVDFPEEKPVFGVNECHLRTVLRGAFQMRRKMLRQSLKKILNEKEMTLPDEWGTMRPEALTPQQFVELTKMIFGPGETPAGIAVWRGKLTDEARDPTLHPTPYTLHVTPYTPHPTTHTPHPTPSFLEPLCRYFSSKVDRI